MTTAIPRDALEQLAINADLDLEDELRLDYSGRGMYGSTCIGIVGSVTTLTHFIRTLSEQVLVGEENGLVPFLEEVHNVRQDSMGRDQIFYWPYITVS